MKVDIVIERNEGLNFRESKDLIRRLINENGSALTEPSKDMISGFSIEEMGWNF